MRIQITDNWLKLNINKPKTLYRKYKTYYNKILNINTIFYYHKCVNIPMHNETKAILIDKVNFYLEQMNIIYYAAKYCEVVVDNMYLNYNYKKYHYISQYIPIGQYSKTVFIGLVSKKEFFSMCKLKREPLIIK